MIPFGRLGFRSIGQELPLTCDFNWFIIFLIWKYDQLFVYYSNLLSRSTTRWFYLIAVLLRIYYSMYSSPIVILKFKLFFLKLSILNDRDLAPTRSRLLRLSLENSLNILVGRRTFFENQHMASLKLANFSWLRIRRILEALRNFTFPILLLRNY